MRRIKTTMHDREASGLLRVAAYCRVSTSFEEQMNSFENQVAIYTEKISRNPNWLLTDIYADPAISGTSDNRPEFKRMIKDAEKKRFDLLLVKSISRFARNTLVSVEKVRYLQSLGIGVIFEKENIDTTKPYSEMMLTILSAFAQEESRNISERVKRGKRMREAQGLIPWNPLYGYTRLDDVPFVIVEHEADVVRRIFNEYVAGKNTSEIMKNLNKEGIPSPGGTLWIRNSVSNILRNERYAGDVLTMKVYCDNYMTHKYKRNQGEVERLLVEDHHDAIVSKTVFNCAQEIRKLRKENTYPYKRFLTCPFCGQGLIRMMAGWGCNCEKCYIPTSKLNSALLNAYEQLVHSKKLDKVSNGIKVQCPVMQTVEYWWLKEMVLRITLSEDGRMLKIHWRHDEITEALTHYTRMRADLKRRENGKKQVAVMSRAHKKTVMKVHARTADGPSEKR